MALKTVYDNSNKVTNTGLSVTYRQKFAQTIKTDPGGGAPEVETNYWEVTRIAKKSYKFVGMTQATAFECAAVKRSQYTRMFTQIHVTPEEVTTNYSIECPSDIAPRHVDGDVWEVSIEVNEMDTTYSIGPSANPASLFPEANARNYDEDAGSSVLTLSSVSRDSTVLSFTYSQDISSFDESALICQYKTDESLTTWTTAERVTSTTASPVTVPDSAVFVRLRYGSLESNVLQSD